MRGSQVPVSLALQLKVTEPGLEPILLPSPHPGPPPCSADVSPAGLVEAGPLAKIRERQGSQPMTSHAETCSAVKREFPGSLVGKMLGLRMGQTHQSPGSLCP